MNIIKGINYKQSRRAFTLPELIVIIVILGILATLVIVRVSSGRAKANDVRMWAEAVSLQEAINRCYLDGGNFGDWGSNPEDLPHDKLFNCSGVGGTYVEGYGYIKEYGTYPTLGGKSSDGGRWDNCKWAASIPAFLCNGTNGMDRTNKIFRYTLVTGVTYKITCTQDKCTKNF